MNPHQITFKHIHMRSRIHWQGWAAHKTACQWNIYYLRRIWRYFFLFCDELTFLSDKSKWAIRLFVLIKQKHVARLGCCTYYPPAAALSVQHCSMEHSSSSNSKQRKRIAVPDAPLKAIGFELEELTPERIIGCFRVTQNSCQVR